LIILVTFEDKNARENIFQKKGAKIKLLKKRKATFYKKVLLKIKVKLKIIQSKVLEIILFYPKWHLPKNFLLLLMIDHSGN